MDGLYMTESPMLCGVSGCETFTWTCFCGLHFPVKQVFSTVDKLNGYGTKVSLLLHLIAGNGDRDLWYHWVCEWTECMILNWDMVKDNESTMEYLSGIHRSMSDDFGFHFFHKYRCILFPNAEKPVILPTFS